MPVNRLERDAILREGLNMADLPSLDRHDRPAGAIDPDAHSIEWLQRAIDLMIQEFPWAGNVTRITGTLASGTLNLTNFAPADFILDVRDGLKIDVGGTTKTLLRQSHQYIIQSQTLRDLGGSPNTAEPSAYAFARRTIRLDVTTDQAFPYIFWYYALPPILASGDVPEFPSDWTLVEFIRLRAKEWAGQLAAGSAIRYLREVEIPALRDAGLGQEPESDYIPLDRNRFRRVQLDSPENRWPFPPNL